MDFDKYKAEWVKGDHKGNRNREAAAENLFKEDLGKEFGWSGKILDAIYEFAWREGHSAGYSDIYSYFSDISDVAKVVKENS